MYIYMCMYVIEYLDNATSRHCIHYTSEYNVDIGYIYNIYILYLCSYMLYIETYIYIYTAVYKCLKINICAWNRRSVLSATKVSGVSNDTVFCAQAPACLALPACLSAWHCLSVCPFVCWCASIPTVLLLVVFFLRHMSLCGSFCLSAWWLRCIADFLSVCSDLLTGCTRLAIWLLWLAIG